VKCDIIWPVAALFLSVKAKEKVFGHLRGVSNLNIVPGFGVKGNA